MEKPIPRDHRLSSLGKPHDAKRRSLGRIFLSYPNTHYRFLYERKENTVRTGPTWRNFQDPRFYQFFFAGDVKHHLEQIFQKDVEASSDIQTIK